jgi:hypothetical protein
MGSVHARGDTFLTFGLKALTETNTSRLATDRDATFSEVLNGGGKYDEMTGENGKNKNN